MRNILLDDFNKIFKYKASILFIFDAQQSYKVLKTLCYRWIAFHNLLKKFQKINNNLLYFTLILFILQVVPFTM